MKKFLLSIAALFLFAGVTNAQEWAFGPKVGVNFSSVNGWEGARTRKGVVAGMFLERMIAPALAIQTDILYSMEGFRLKSSGETTKVNLDYIKMPIVLKYYLVRGLNLQLGGQVGYLVTKNLENNTLGYNLEHYTNRFSVDMVAGLSYDFCFGLILEGRYTTGVTKIFNNGSGIANGTLQVAAGWRF